MGQAMGGGSEAPADEGLWAKARQSYEQGTVAVSAIAATLGITPQALTAKARALGWALRTAAKPKPPRTRDTIARLRNLLQQRLGDLERAVGALGAEATSASSERDIRALNGLVRTLEKVIELERKDRTRRSKDRKHFRSLDDAERDALAGKLEALRREYSGASDFETPEPEGNGGTQS